MTRKPEPIFQEEYKGYKINVWAPRGLTRTITADGPVNYRFGIIVDGPEMVGQAIDAAKQDIDLAIKNRMEGDAG